ncbi:MAG TPA: aminotransferase class I/II-fold pyridoxal phosphate-dependent enzyme, partial [Aggregatilineales bacterium]|nr:aminotransferase class I/II-fold pyridoxal phosphate-dependent enzyme [Aggregatilineales bacterium]
MTSDQARRMEDIPASSIRRVFEEVNVLQAQGQKVIPLHIGQPDFDTPEHIKAAAKQALDDGLTGYTSNRGLPQLRQALAEKLRRENGLTVDPDKQIIVTVGANEAILMATMAFVNPGDEVLVLSPTWLHYFYCVRMAGGIPVEVPLRASNNFLIDPDDIRRRITNRTRMLIVNTPHNPTGAVYPYAVLKEIAQIVEQHGLLLLSDEIYEKLIYGEAEHVSLAGFDNIADRTLTINGFSKAYAMTGWRLGYIISSPEHSSTLLRVHQYTTVCATSFAQAGAVAAL